MSCSTNTPTNKNIALNSGENSKFTKEYITQRLKEANIPVERGIKLKKGTKRPAVKWRNVDLPPIDEIDSHFGIRTGNGLVIIDVDSWENLPESLKTFLENNPTLVIKSPHSDGKDGHYYYATGSKINENPSGCDIQGEGGIVADGGKIWGIRNGQDCKHDCCCRSNPGEYTVKNDRQITHIEAEEIESAVPTDNDTSQKDSTGKIPDWDSVDLEEIDYEEGESVLKKLQSDHTAFFNDLLDRLNSGRGNMGESLDKDGGKIDRSLLDYSCIKDLYGVARYYGYSYSEGRGLAGKIYNKFAQEQPYLKDGQKRKWNKRGGSYRIGVIDNAVQDFDIEGFTKLINQTNGNKFSGEYSNIDYKFARFVINWLIEGWDIQFAKEMAKIGYDIIVEEEQLREVTNTKQYEGTNPPSEVRYNYNYPTTKTVRQVCATLDSRSESTYRTVIQNLRRNGEIKQAKIDYQSHVVYPSNKEDPNRAEHIRTNGEKYE